MIEQLFLFVRMMRLKVVVTLWTFMLLGLARHTAHLTSPTPGADGNAPTFRWSAVSSSCSSRG